MLRLVAVLAFRQLRNRPGEALVIVFSVAAGVLLAAATHPAIALAAKGLGRVVAHAAGSAALHVLPSAAGRVPQASTEIVRRTDGVARVVPVLDVMARLDSPSGRAVRLVAMPLLHGDTETLFDDAVDSASRASWERVAREPRTVAVTQELARREGIRLFGRMNIALDSRRAEFVVGAFLQDDALPLGTGDAVVMQLHLAQRSFGLDDGVDRIEVAVSPSANVSDVAGRLRAALGPGVRIERPEKRRAHVDDMLRAIALMVVFLDGIGLFAAGLVVFGIVSVRTTARRREAAAWRAVGATPVQTMLALIVDAAVLGVAGAVLGVMTSVWASGRLIGAASALIEGLTLRASPMQPEPASWSMLLASGVAGILTATLAAALAAWLGASREVDAELRPGHAKRPLWAREGVRLALAVGIACVGMIPLLTGRDGLGDGILGAAASVCFVPATYLAVPAVVRSVLTLLVRPIGATLGVAGRLAARSLVRHRASIALPVTILALAVEVGTAVSAVAASFEESLVAWVSGLAARSLFVTRAESLVAQDPAPVEPSVVEELERLPNVRRARIVRHRRVELAGAEIALRASGVSPPFFDEDRRRYRVVEGDLERALPGLAGGTGALVSESYARRTGARVGARLELPTPTGPVNFEILAVVVDYMAPGGTVVIGRDAYVARWQDPAIDGVFIDLDAAADAEAVHAQIAQLASRHGLSILEPPGFVADVNRILHRAVLPLYGLALLVFVVGLCGMVNALLAATLARAHEHALLRAVGATPLQVALAMLLEGLAATLVAGVLGGFAGAIGAYGWVRGTVPAATGWLVQYAVPARPVIETVAIAMILAAIPLTLPAMRARALSLAAGVVR